MHHPPKASVPPRCSHALSGLGLALSLVAGIAGAQPAQQVTGPWTLQASTVSVESLPPTMREKYGLPAGDNQAILNVTVQFRSSDGAPENRPAQVRATASNLYGVKTDIPMREVRANGLVSYMGVYRFMPREVLDFRVEATPEGGQSPLVLEFRDRLGRR